MNHAKNPVRVAAIGDLHCTSDSRGALQPIFTKMAEGADVLLLCGDLTDNGLPDEARILAAELRPANQLPILGVLGNHDFESAKQDEVKKILSGTGVHVLNGDALVLHGIGFAGAKGFLGGFGRRILQGWGEPSIKALVRDTVEEGLKLESALAKLRMEQKVVLTHYSPVLGTVQGEPAEIYPFLGSSRLEDPINRYSVAAAFHGHAHYGSPEGRTTNGTPVYNVAMPMLKRAYPDKPPFRVIHIPAKKGA